MKPIGLTQRKIFSCFCFKGEALNLNYSVTDVCRYSPDEGQTPLFKNIVLAFCVYKPMTPDEVKNLIEPIGLMPVTVESFGGNEQKYQEWLKSEKKAMNVGVS